MIAYTLGHSLLLNQATLKSTFLALSGFPLAKKNLADSGTNYKIVI